MSMDMILKNFSLDNYNSLLNYIVESKPRLIMVEGYEMVGKTTLINNLYKSLSSKGFTVIKYSPNYREIEYDKIVGHNRGAIGVPVLDMYSEMMKELPDKFILILDRSVLSAKTYREVYNVNHTSEVSDEEFSCLEEAYYTLLSKFNKKALTILVTLGTGLLQSNLLDEDDPIVKHLNKCEEERYGQFGLSNEYDNDAMKDYIEYYYKFNYLYLKYGIQLASNGLTEFIEYNNEGILDSDSQIDDREDNDCEVEELEEESDEDTMDD